MAEHRLGTGGKFGWLKRTHGHPLTGPEFRVLVSIFNATGSDGRHAHPGIDRLIEQTGYRRTGISEAVSGLKSKGWIHQLYRGNGKSKRASIFDLVPDAPNPAYRCPEDRAGKCSDCSNSSARADVLTPSNSSATAEVLDPNSSGRPDPAPGETGPIVPPERTPSDPLGSDLLGVLTERPSDPSRSSGNENRNRDPFLSGPLHGPSGSPEDIPPPGGEDDRRDDKSLRESEGAKPKGWGGLGRDPFDYGWPERKPPSDKGGLVRAGPGSDDA